MRPTVLRHPLKQFGDSSKYVRRAAAEIVTRHANSRTASPPHQPHYILGRTKHLKYGKECPELALNTLRLYSMKWCPFAQRTRLVLAYKQLPHEEVNINLSSKPDWLLEKNPPGTVPLLEFKSSADDGDNKHPILKRVIGSLECCHWLEKVYPSDKPTLFSNADETLSSRLLLQFESVSRLMQRYISDRVMNEHLTESLRGLEDILVDNRNFVNGAAVTMTDFLLWPGFERFLATGYSVEYLPKLRRWVANMSSLPAVIDVRNSDYGYEKYWEGQRVGRPDYDMPL